MDRFGNVCKEAFALLEMKRHVALYVCVCSVARLELVDMKNAHCTWARIARVEVHVVHSAGNVHLG